MPPKLPSCHLGSWGNLTMTTPQCSWTTSPISPGATFPHPYIGRRAHTRTFEPTWRLSTTGSGRSSDARPCHLSQLGKRTRIWPSSISTTSPTSPTGPRGWIPSRTLTRSPTTKLPTWLVKWLAGGLKTTNYKKVALSSKDISRDIVHCSMHERFAYIS